MFTSGEIDDVAITDLPCGPGIYVSSGTDVAVTNSSVENADGGVYIDNGNVTADGNTLTNVRYGLAAPSPPFFGQLVATGNTIVGPGEGSGIVFGDNVTGEASGNSITNFKGADPGQTSCGILIVAGAGAGAIGTNTFPDPPGNEQDVCGHRKDTHGRQRCAESIAHSAALAPGGSSGHPAPLWLPKFPTFPKIAVSAPPAPRLPASPEWGNFRMDAVPQPPYRAPGVLDDDGVEGAHPVHGARIDGVARLLASPADRRAAARALAGGAIAALGLAASHADAKKKKKKKCKSPQVTCGKRCCAAGFVCSGGACALPDECDFAKSAVLWTLQADCTITRTITIPDNIILDGSNKTIAMTGQASAYTAAPGVGAAAGILAQGGTGDVRNLTIAGAGVQGSLDELFAALVFHNRSGLIEAVTISGIRPTGATPNGFGISTSAAGGNHAVSLKDVAVSAVSAIAVSVDGLTATLDEADLDSDGTALQVSNAAATVTDSLIASANVAMVATDSTVTLRRNTFRAPETAITLLGETVAEVRNNTFDGTGKQALFGANGADLTIADNTVTGYVVGFSFESEPIFGSGADDSVAADVTGNTITGVGTPAGAGIRYGRLAAGDVSANTVSNFLDGGSSQTNCGILLTEDAGAAVVGSNTFPDPPGNEQNVCDLR